MPKLLLNKFVLFLGIFPWIVYASTLHIGLDSLIDEGQMLLLLNRPHPLGHLGSQSGVIIGLITDHFNYDAITLLRIRFLVQCVAVFVLCICSLIYREDIVATKTLPKETCDGPPSGSLLNYLR